VIDRLRPQVAGLAINANGDPARFAEFGLPVLPDSLPDIPARWRACWPGSTGRRGRGRRPSSPPPPTRPSSRRPGRAAAGAAGPAGLALAASPDRQRAVQRHPTFGLWPVALREDLRDALRGGLRKIVLWTDPRRRHAEFPAAVRSLLQRQHPRGHRPAPRHWRAGMRLYGVTGWKNTGKTGLMERLVGRDQRPRPDGIDRQARPSRNRDRPSRPRQPPPPRGRRARGDRRLAPTAGR
jgi:hypothetical protein